MDSSPTLHDFVLNLLTDTTARSAFELDPEGALQDAGLGDITAADVREVIPLVVDYAPVEGIVPPALPEQLTTAVPELDVAGAVRQLHAVTQQIALSTPYPSSEVNATAVGAVTAGGGELFTDQLTPLTGFDLGGLGTGLGGLSGSNDAVVPGVTGADGANGLSIDHDPAAGLDADLLAPVSGTTGGLGVDTGQAITEATGGDVFGTLDIAANNVTGLAPNGLLDPLYLDDAAILPATTSTVGSVVGGVDSAVNNVVNIDAPLHGLHETVTGVGGLVGDLTDPADVTIGQHDPTGVTDLLF